MKFIIATFFALGLAIQAECQDQKPPTINSKQVNDVIDTLEWALNRYYVFPEKAKVMGAYIRAQHKKGAYKKITSPNQLADQLRSDLQKAHPDPHMGVFYDPQFAKEDPGKKADRHDEQLRFLKERNFFFNKVEILPANIGYFKFNGFNPMVAESKPTLAAVFSFLKNTSAIIIDLRENHGGSPEMVKQIESYFFKERTHMMDIVDRPENATHELWAGPADTDSLTLSMPVYILTSHGTFSGAEDFSYGMQSVKRATIIGETTGGGAHPTGPYTLGHGFVASIPFARSLNPYTNTDWEGTGVVPDIAVPASEALLKALEVHLATKKDPNSDEQGKRREQWLLDKLKADIRPACMDPDLVSKYTGVYEGGLDFYLNDCHFFCKNGELGNAVFELKAISDTHFLLDDNVIVEFLEPKGGQPASLVMHWSDGGLSSKKRN